MDNFKNFSKAIVSTGYDASATTVVLSANEGAKLPTAPFNATWYNATDYADPTDDPNVEIIRVTVVSTDTLTVTRAQESTTAKTHNTGGKEYKLIVGLTAKTLNTDIAPYLTDIIRADGWKTLSETFTYASASTITVASGAATRFQKGDKIKLTQTTAKYFYIKTVADTLLTVTGGTDYTLANAAITTPFISRENSPIGFPIEFNVATRQVMSMEGGLMTIRGWDFLTGNGVGDTKSQTITFGVAFSTRPYIGSSALGYKDSSDPTHVGDFSNGGFGNNDIIVCYAIGTTNFGEAISKSNGAVLDNGRRFGHSWIAVGQI